MAFKFHSISKADKEITSADAIIDPALASSGITTIQVEGKQFPASEAPLASKISALIAVNPPGAGTQQISDVLVSNDVISKELEKVSTELTISKNSVAVLTQDNANLKQSEGVAQASVSKLTAENAEQKNRLEAAINQFTSNAKEIASVNREVSKACVACGCLDLQGEDGKPLAADATEEAKLAAADKISVSDKLKSYQGAVNAAVAKIGVLPSSIPSANATLANVGNLAVRKQYEAITDSQERVAFYRANKSAIDATYK